MRRWKNHTGFSFKGLLIDTLISDFIDDKGISEIYYSDYNILLKDIFEYFSNQDRNREYWYALGSNQKIYNNDGAKFINKAKKALKRIEDASEEEKDYASVIANAPFHSYSGECTYCGHCKPCVSNLDIAMINKFYDLATMQPKVPATVQSHYELLEHKASECIGCHACEARCPFGVPIAERMEKTAKLFGC